MPAIVQYEFNNENQWRSAGEPKLIETALAITPLGLNPETGKYHVEALFEDRLVDVLDENGNPTGEQEWVDDVPDNGLLTAKTVKPVPHQFLGYETLEEYEIRKGIRPDPNQS